ncbi:MAG: hypothetical protein IPJ19_21130 [Planctomycetes bacterium]|nr:hypothetical protein [Planctomycetota bacterium]
MNDREPSADELLAMAYADGELTPQERARFEARMAGEPRLAREVSELRRLAVLARAVAPPEPMDHEWARLARSATQRGLPLGTGWILLLAGLSGLAGWGLVCLECSAASWVPKLFVPLVLAGAALLMAGALRARARTLPFDPYRDIKR